MTVNAVRLNHAVLFVADLERSISFYSEVFGMTVMAREPRANAAFLRLPRSGNHHDLGLFGVGAQPPRPRGGLGLYHLAWQVDTVEELEQARLTLADARRLHRRVQPRRDQERLRHGPRRQRVRGHVDAAPQASWGDYAERRTHRPARPARRGPPAGPASAPPPSSCPVDDVDDRRRPSRRPVVATHGAADPAAPLVVLLHGRGSNEPEILGLAAHLPAGPEYAAVRAPIAEGGGYAWFANRGIGRPLADSLREHDGLVPHLARRGRPGRTAGDPGRVQRRRRLRRRPRARRPRAVRRRSHPLRHPPFDAGLATDPGRLATCPSSSPRARTTTSSPASCSTAPGTTCCPSPAPPPSPSVSPAGTSSPPRPSATSASWLARPARVRRPARRRPRRPGGRATWATLPGGELPGRAGARPRSAGPSRSSRSPTTPPPSCRSSSSTRSAPCPAWTSGPSAHLGARRARLHPAARAPTTSRPPRPEVGEFAHLHPAHDGSLHLVLPPDLAADVIAKGWGRPHMWAGTRLSPGFMMVYGPRDENELATVLGIVAASHAYAIGREALAH